MKRAQKMFRTHKHQRTAGVAHIVSAESQRRVGLGSQCPRHGVGLIVEFARGGKNAILRTLWDRHRPRCVVQYQGNRARSKANPVRHGPQCHGASLIQSISLLSDHAVANHVVPFIPGAGDPAARREMTPSAPLAASSRVRKPIRNSDSEGQGETRAQRRLDAGIRGRTTNYSKEKLPDQSDKHSAQSPIKKNYRGDHHWRVCLYCCCCCCSCSVRGLRGANIGRDWITMLGGSGCGSGAFEGLTVTDTLSSLSASPL